MKISTACSGNGEDKNSRKILKPYTFGILPATVSDECWQEELKGVIASTRWQQWMQVFPITEDIELCQLPPLAEIHAHLDFTTSHRGQLTDMQEVSYLFRKNGVDVLFILGVLVFCFWRKRFTKERMCVCFSSLCMQ